MKCGVESGECEVWSECGVQSMEWSVESVKCEVLSAECEV